MAHFGFICPPFRGHLDPMQALAGELRAMGHETTFVGLGDMATLLGPQAPLAVVGQRSHPPGTLARITAHMADPAGLKLFRIMRDMSCMTDMLCREAPAAIRETAIDCLVVDQLEPAGGLVAAHLGLPFVSVANALLINREPGIPPPFTDWRSDPTERGIRRNLGGYRVADLMMTGMGRVIARHARAWGLAPRRRIDTCLSEQAQISQTVPGFDFPRSDLPTIMHQCGPLRSAEAHADLDGLLGDGRPLVFASLGTLQGGRVGTFRAIAQACEDLGLNLVIAHGGRLTPDEAASMPGRPAVRSFVPQRTLLRHATLAITNGGLNTVMDALAAAVPVITIPIAFEQGAVGARLEACGAGATTPLRKLTTTRLRTTMAHVLSTSSFAAAAQRLAGEIAGAGGVARAATHVENVARGAVSSNSREPRSAAS